MKSRLWSVILSVTQWSEESINKFMKELGQHNYFVYITTNYNKTVLYTEVTNNLSRRLYEHKQHAKENRTHFTAKYKAFYLVFYERFHNVEDAIRREKQIKSKTRNKKNALVEEFNPKWKFLNDEIT